MPTYGYTNPIFRNLQEYRGLLGFVVDLVVLELEGRFVGGDDVQEISQLLFLQIFLAQVLQISLGERKFSSNADLGLIPGNSDLTSSLASLGAMDLDLGAQIFLEVGSVNDSVLHRRRQVNGELGDLLSLGLLNTLLQNQHIRSTTRINYLYTYMLNSSHVTVHMLEGPISRTRNALPAAGRANNNPAVKSSDRHVNNHHHHHHDTTTPTTAAPNNYQKSQEEN
jgi:hypothetical protein